VTAWAPVLSARSLVAWSAVVGGVAGVLGIDERPRFRSYVVERRLPSYQYREDVRVGAVLPEEGVTYYEAPREYGVRDYRYTVVNGRSYWSTAALLKS
jgi:hypothetical protein